MAILFEIVIGIVAGVLAGIRKGRFSDNLVLVATMFVISIPMFVIGALLQYFLGVKLGLFPVTVPPGAPCLRAAAARVRAWRPLARLRRPPRPAPIVENLRADYVRTAIAKGLTRRRAIGLHAMRNSLIPVVTFIGVDFGALLGGAIVTERIFNIPGVGGLHSGHPDP